VLSNAVLAAPAFAEAGKIFDFNATLPLMAGQFLLLMIILDKLVYSPVGKVLDERDTDLRTKLEAVKDNAGDLMKFTTEADGIIRAARDEAAAEIAKAKDEAEKESSQKIGAAKAKLDAELKSAVSALEQQRAASMASIDTEVNKLSDSIVKKVLVSA
jgi:F-type H+-transporting ATPase subunit b